MAARTGRYAKRMKTLLRPYNFDDKNPITMIHFLAQFKSTYDLNGVCGGLDLWTVPTFIIGGPASSTTAEMTPHKDDGTTYRLLMAGEKQISTYMEAGAF